MPDISRSSSMPGVCIVSMGGQRGGHGEAQSPIERILATERKGKLIVTTVAGASHFEAYKALRMGTIRVEDSASFDILGTSTLGSL